MNYASNSTLCTCCVVDDDLCVCVWGGGLGDFLDKLSGCCGSAMSTCNSMRRGLALGGAADDGAAAAVALFVTGGDVDVECGDWKYRCSLPLGDGVCWCRDPTEVMTLCVGHRLLPDEKGHWLGEFVSVTMRLPLPDCGRSVDDRRGLL